MSEFLQSQAYFNGFISSGRNVFLTSSVAVALFGYSSTFKIKSSIKLSWFHLCKCKNLSFIR